MRERKPTMKNSEKKTEYFDIGASPPKPEKKPTCSQIHGETLVDDYGWLAAANWREALQDPNLLPKNIKDLIESENDYCEQVVKPLALLRKTLITEMRARIKETDGDVPDFDDNYEYYEKFQEGAEYPLYCRRPRGGWEETILLDIETRAQNKDFFDVGEISHSPDHTQLAWSVDENGCEMFKIYSKKISDDHDRADVVSNTDGAIVWNTSAQAFYYVVMDENHRPSQVWRHTIGSNPTTDKLILEELDNAWSISLSQSRCRNYGVVSLHGHESTECWLIDLNNEILPPQLVTKRQYGLRYEVEPHGDLLYILNNHGSADDFQISIAPLNKPEISCWQEIVSHEPGSMITSMTVFNDFLVWIKHNDTVPTLYVREFSSQAQHILTFDEAAYVLELSPGFEFKTNILRFTYSSLKTPEEIYDYNMATRERVLLKKQEIPSGHEPNDYVTLRLFAPTPDGELIPVTLLHHKKFTPGVGAPLLLYGYGAYGYSVEAAFDENILSLIDRGFVYAIAHVRGGCEKGWRWYTQGKLTHKKNSFSDFISVAKFLIDTGYTYLGGIIAQGASAGGMLMGAIVNQEPALFAGVIAGVPFVDVLNTMLRDDLPLTPPEWLEWGNPIKDATAFHEISAYSPYDNIKQQFYPPILCITGISDSRVTYWEPLKWISKIRALMQGAGPILLWTHLDSGHAGASGRFKSLSDVALEFAFAIACIHTSTKACKHS